MEKKVGQEILEKYGKMATKSEKFPVFTKLH